MPLAFISSRRILPVTMLPKNPTAETLRLGNGAASGLPSVSVFASKSCQDAASLVKTKFWAIQGTTPAELSVKVAVDAYQLVLMRMAIWTVVAALLLRVKKLMLVI